MQGKRLIIFILITFAVFSKLSAGETANVLLLNSYHKGYLWTDEITRGIEETLLGNGVDLHVEYLDTKRFFSPEYFDQLSGLLTFKHKSFQYDLILLSDNNAFDFYKQRGSEIFGDVPVVFSGYNYLEEDALEGMDNITGVNERADLEINLDLIERIHPDISRIIVISDNTVTGSQINDELRKIKSTRSADKPELTLIDNVSMEELIFLLGSLGDDTIVYLTVFFRDKEGVFFEYDTASEMISRASSVPVYGTWSFHLGHGIIGGYLVDGFHQGRSAAQMALSILEGTDPRDIPPLMDTPVELSFDYEQLIRFEINMFRLPEQRIIVNWPESFLIKYRIQISVVLALIVLLVFAFLAVLYGFILSRRAEKEVRNHEEDLRTTLYSIGDAVISTDLNQRVVRMNPVAEILTGWLNGEAMGKPIDEIFKIYNALTGEEVENPVANVLRDGDISGIPRHTTLVARDGREYKISDSAAPIHDDDGTVTGVVLVFRNISEEYRIQEELLKERNYVRRIINNAPSLICGLDTHGITVFINPVIEKITGYSEEEIIGKNFWKLFYPGEEFLQVKKLLKDSLDGVVVDYEMTLTCRNGDRKTIVWNSFSRKDGDGNISGYLGFGYDITNLKMAEKKLYETNLELVNHKNNLEEIVADRTLELQLSLEHLQHTQEKLVESEKMAALGGLVAGVAHEINTPVGIGVTAASHLEEVIDDFRQLYDAGKVTKKDFENFLSLCSDSSSMILANMKRAADLIHSFKQVAVDQSSQGIRSFQIKMYMEEILMSLHAQLRRTSFEVLFNCPEEFLVNSNPGALSQIITNLVMNSLTHGFEGMDEGSITIDVRKSDDQALIIYGDTGRGIPENNLRKIFEPFFTTKRGEGGSGLGMNIVYNLVTQSLGGHINCTSEEGKGTWFEIEFPLKIQKEGA